MPNDVDLDSESQRRIDWQSRHVSWLAERLTGDFEGKLQFLDMWFAAMHHRHDEGLADALDIVRQIHKQFPCRQTEALEKAISELRQLNEKDFKSVSGSV